MKALKNLLDAHVIDAVICGQYIDVFSLFGIHPADQGKHRICVFLPGAQAVTMVSASGKAVLVNLQREHVDGLFCAEFKRKVPAAYKLRVQYPLASFDIEDPYRFPSQLQEDELYLFNDGSQERAYHFLGCNHRVIDGVEGKLFAVWAPNAQRVSVVGDFNFWDGRVHIMRRHHSAGVWEIFIPNINPGQCYKYEIVGADGNVLPLKADPYAKRMQLRPDNASVVPEISSYQWTDSTWMAARRETPHHNAAMSIYEVQLGSWKRKPEQNNHYLSYDELTEQLIPYVVDLGFTHIQLMPVSEYPFDGSWGYQPLGMFAPTSRFGSPDDFRRFIDAAHAAGIGVLLDWVPGHFPTDAHGLGQFDGTHLYEHSDPRQGFHPDWNTLIFNYGRAEVVSYLLSNAMFWLEEFHIDGLRFDAVASMLYLDYSRKQGEWIPNHHGGRENLEAIAFLRNLNRRAYFNYPGGMMIAEESTAWPGVTDFVDRGGLGFGFKWNLGWMNDTLSYMCRDAIHRKYHHHEMTFGLLYAFTEKFILPLSHDEVVHGKRSILGRMPGDEWQRFANLRAYYGFMWTHPGKKLLFMGGEFAQHNEWNHDNSLDWHLLEYSPHQQIQSWIKDLNNFYLQSPALYANDSSGESFEWIEADNYANSVFAYVRRGGGQVVITIVNLTPTLHRHARIGVPESGFYRERLNSDSELYGGTGSGNYGGLEAEHIGSHGRPWSINATLPPLATIILVLDSAAAEA